ncbi:gamma-glutamyl-gamma-aminobutyrate hydrolase family protein [bacterium]|nr:gamma-glutamyl-gamma-aminobutyrate hydrolase family protein [bacterium]
MNKKVLVIDGWGSYVKLMSSIGEVVTDTKEFLKNPGDFKLVLFTGGEDVCPSLYKHTSPKNMCHYNITRDIIEEEIYVCALENDIPMTGICRGSQFLNVMCGGVLMHHITGHGENHVMETLTGHKINVTSTHHQMCVPNTNGFVLAWSAKRRSKFYFGDKDLQIDYDGPEVESVYYPANKVFAVQYHPEYMPQDCDAVKWYLGGVNDLLNMSEAAFKAKYIGRVTLAAQL